MNVAMNIADGKVRILESPESFADELAEALELKLLGADTVDGIDWNDYASRILSDYHEALTNVYLNQKPLWRELHETSAKLDPSTGIHIVYAQLLTVIGDRLEVEFGYSTINDFFKSETKKALSCE